MLIRFTAANHRSIKEPIELSMVAVDRDRPAVRHFQRLHEGVLPVAGIYGPNASGKSNVLDALAWLSQAVRDSLRLWDGYIPRDPFRFAGQPTEPSLFGLDFLLGGVRHTYTLQLTEHGVEFEELLSYPERRQRTLFVREGANVTFRRGQSGTAGIKDLLTPTTLVLTLAQRLEVSGLISAAQFIAGIAAPAPRGQHEDSWRRVISLFKARPVSVSQPPTYKIFFDAHRSSGDHQENVLAVTSARSLNERSTARSLLRFADLGIDDVEVIEVPRPETGGTLLDLRLVHKVGTEEERFELRDESGGTRKWFELLGPALTALRRGTPLILDEIDASLHPQLSAKLLDLFRDATTNPLGAQLIFTSHDTSLLGELNRDEVWFTEKGADGATRLTALAEFGGDRVRRSVNLERAYLQGRFGALPNLHDGDLAELADGLFDQAETSARPPRDPIDDADE
jgi:uncharacterized protein